MATRLTEFVMLGLSLTVLAIALFLYKRQALSLLLFFGMITNGFQLVPSSILLAGAPFEKSTDLALFYLLALLIYRFDAFRRAVHQEAIFGWIVAFFGFVVVDALYSYLILDYEAGGIIKILRTYLFLLSFGVLIVVPTRTLMRVLHLLSVITLVQCVIFLIQLPTGMTLLLSQAAGSAVNVNEVQGFGFTRFYNTPLYLTPVLFYYLFVYRFRSKLIQTGIVGLLLLTTLAPLHRANIMTLFLVLSLYVLLRQGSNRRALYLSALVIVGYLATLIDIVSYRINEAFADISATFSGTPTAMDYTNNTLAFRLAHFTERFTYVMSIPFGWLFGIGLLGESTPQAAKLPFQVGIFQERLDRVTQIDTGDVLWSLLVLQLGLLGSLFYGALLIKFVRFLYGRLRATPYSVVGFLWLVQGLMGSMISTELMMVPFRVLLVYLTVLVVKSTNQAVGRPSSPARPYTNRPSIGRPAEELIPTLH